MVPATRSGSTIGLLPSSSCAARSFPRGVRWCGRAQDRPVAVTHGMPAPRDVEERRTTAFERGPSEPAAIRELPSADGRPVVVVRLRECPGCGLLQRLPSPFAARGRGAVFVLRRRRVDPVRRSLALALTGLLLFALAVVLPFLDVNVIGRERETLLLTGPLELQQHGV
jgi:hypothetical protein